MMKKDRIPLEPQKAGTDTLFQLPKSESVPVFCLWQKLEELYRRYNRVEYISPDPLEFVVLQRDWRDCEVVGLVAGSLAFGSVVQINRSVGSVLEMLAEPRRCVLEMPRRELSRAFNGFRHRYTDGGNLIDLLLGIRRVLERYGTLEECFREGLCEEDETVLPALDLFVARLREGFDGRRNYLLSSPCDGSACKRMHLYLRWMVRRDSVDPGPWHDVPAAKLVVPLDTHMHRVALRLGLTRRKQANGATAVEITRAFRSVVPEDPVKYDFALTRPGIRRELVDDPFWGSIG